MASLGFSGSAFERVAWAAVLAVPAAVPLAVSKILFTDAPALTLNLYVVPKVFALSLLMSVALVAWAIGVLRGTIAVRTVPLAGWLGAFLLLASVSTLMGMHPSSSFFGGRYQLAGLLVFLLASALYFLIVQLVRSAERVRAMSWSVVTGGTIVAAVGLLQAAGMDPLRLFDPKYPYLTFRGGSLLGNPDFTGSYLVVPVVIAAAIALSGSTRTTRGVGVGCLVVTLLGLLNTGTRGGWLGAAVGLVLLGVAFARSSGRINRTGIIAIAAALGVPLLWVVLNLGRLASRFADFAQGVSGLGGGRLAIWGDAVRVIGERPLLGTGPDVYRLGWYGVRSLAWVESVGANVINEDPHNLILLFAATLGIPATIAAVGFVGAAIVMSGRTALQKDAAVGRLIVSGWWAALVGFSITLLFTTNSATVMTMLFTALGMVVTVRSKPLESSKPLRYALVAGALLLAVTAATVGTLYLSADALLMQAQMAEDKAAATDRAARLAPWYGDARYQAALAEANFAVDALDSGVPDAASAAQRAEVRLEQLVASNPHEYQFRAAQAYFLINAGAVLGPEVLTRAVAAGQAALEVSPLSAHAAYLKGLAQLGLGDPVAATATLEPLWDVDPTYLDPGVVYFRALVSAGEKSKAAEVLATLQSRFPENPEVSALAQLLEPGTGAP